MSVHLWSMSKLKTEGKGEDVGYKNDWLIEIRKMCNFPFFGN